MPYAGERGIRALARTACTSASAGTPSSRAATSSRCSRQDCPKGGVGQPRAWRPARAVGRAARNRARDLRGAPPASRRGRRGRRELGIGFLGIGFSPKWTLGETPVHAQGALSHHAPLYADARAARPRHDVPHRDGSGESRLRRRGRHGREAARWLALQPIATALFANSPFTEGKPNGFQSYRAEMWRDTDPDRTGMLPFAFEPGMGFERYVDYALDVPMYFVYRDGTLYRRGRRLVPGFSRGQAHGAAGRAGRRSTIGPIISPRCFPMCG